MFVHAHTRSAQAQQRHNVAWLSLALCMWFIAVASHFHVADKEAPSHDRAHACSFCLSAPTAASAPASLPEIARIAVVDVLIAASDLPAVSFDPASSYFSRGPPA